MFKLVKFAMSRLFNTLPPNSFENLVYLAMGWDAPLKKNIAVYKKALDAKYQTQSKSEKNGIYCVWVKTMKNVKAKLPFSDQHCRYSFNKNGGRYSGLWLNVSFSFGTHV